MPSRSAN